MTRRLGLIVTDASPLITLAAGDALECLTMPALRVVIPDMVYFEVAQDLARTGAADIVEWARRHQGQVELAPTSVFSEFQIVLAADPKARSKGRGEQSAAEILNAEIAKDADLEALLLYEDNDIRVRRFAGALPERVMTLSTGDLLRELEAAGRIQSADHILDVAAEKERNVASQRRPQSDAEARALLRRQLERGRDDPGSARWETGM
jgi:hypothetical protein